ncbi:hypothetical protein D9M71_491260 [compost metagenome]
MGLEQSNRPSPLHHLIHHNQKALVTSLLAFFGVLGIEKGNLFQASRLARAVLFHQIEWGLFRVSLGENQLTQPTSYLSLIQNSHHN